MQHNDIFDDILEHAAKSQLDQFIKQYAGDNEAFKSAFLEEFSPKPKASKTPKKPNDDYAKIIIQAFKDSSFSTSRNRYNSYYDDIGFDADAVREKLEPLLDKAYFHIRYENMEEAVLIAQKLIEIIPDIWDKNFDYEGEIQDVYDTAIDLLQKLLLEDKLTTAQKESLFTWYEKEIADKKHKYVGLNTSLGVLEEYLASDVEEGLQRVLHIVDQRINNSTEEYEKEKAIIKKIHLLEENGREADAEKTIDQHIDYQLVRRIRLKRLLEEEQYTSANQLLRKGIEIAKNKHHGGTVRTWKEELISVYERLNDRPKIIEINKELFSSGWEQRKYYRALKKITPKNEWNEMLNWILKQVDSGRYFGFNALKADIYVEHKMWDELWQLCRKGSISAIVKYEKHLRPRYEKEIFAEYLNYAQQQATITHKEAYKNVADTLIRMKSFEGGTDTVKQLVAQYRQTYKRRTSMMRELNKVEV